MNGEQEFPEEATQSKTVGELAKALAKVQATVQNAKKDARNPHLKSKYADLASVREAVSRPLADQGIAVVQTMEPHGMSGVCVVTTLMHSSGEWIRGRCFIPVPESKNPAQSFGSALTYARRYSLAAIVGIAADEDDDAETASPRAPSSGPQLQQSQPTEERVQKARSAIDACKTIDELDAVGAALKKSPAEIQQAVTSDYVAKLNALKGQAA